MVATAATDGAALVDEEARLARAAAAGDGSAFATLYERYERRAYNLAFRVGGSEEDAADAVQEAFLSVMRRLPQLDERELEFGPYLFAATRNACYDLIRRRQRTQPSDSIPESAVPLGSGAGGLGLDPGDPEEDPGRRALLAAQQEEIREANMRLPERQREALALRELEELSYDEIAAIMEMNRNSVAQLISRARVNLRDELRGTALASVVSSSPECERALPLIAMRDDGQLDEGSEDAGWLGAHLAGCDTCRLGLEAMQEAGVSYRAWAPIAAAPGLLEETMARAAELVGAEWSAEIAAALKARAPRRSRRARAAAAAGLAALLIAGLAALLARGDPASGPAEPAAGSGPAPSAAPAQPGPRSAGPAERQGEPSGKAQQTTVPDPPLSSPPPPPAAESQTPTGDPPPAPATRPPGAGAVEPPRSVTPARPRPQPEPPPQAPVAPPPTEPPAVEEEPEPPEPPRDPTPPTGPPVVNGPN